MTESEDFEFVAIVTSEKGEELDRSLPLEIVWPNESETQDNKFIEEETLPDFTSGDESVTQIVPRQTSLDNQQDFIRRDKMQQCAEEPSSPSNKETSKRLRKFISRSHNSLVSRPADYSKVESKVKQYIVTMKEQQEHRRRTPPLSRKFQPSPASSEQNAQPTSFIEPTENVDDLKRQLADQAARVEVLQEEHDRLFLQNARLLNMIDEMRFKLYGRHSNQSHRQTNSPSEFCTSGTNHNKNSIDSAISLPTHIDQESTFGYGDAGSTSFRSTTGSIFDETKQFGSTFKAANKSLAEVEATYKSFIASGQINGCDKKSKTLLKQLHEATAIALTVRDQTRTLVQTINKMKR